MKITTRSIFARTTSERHFSLRSVSFCAAAFVAGLACMSNVQAEDDICPPKMKGKFSAGSYQFQYQSWSWKSSEDDEEYAYCHCIRNESQSNGLFVNWEKTGLRAFLRPLKAGYSYFSYPYSKEARQSADLWYGAKPEKIDTEIVHNAAAARLLEPMKQEQSTKASEPVKLEKSTQPSTTKKAPKPLRSASSAAIPNLLAISQILSVNPEKIRSADIISTAENRPDVLVPIEMEFRSTLTLDDKTGRWATVDNTCVYRIGSRNSRDQLKFKMRITDGALHQSIFGSTKPVSIRGDWSGTEKTFNGSIDLSKGSSWMIERSSAELQILDPDERIILSSLPIMHYRAFSSR